MVQEGDLHQGAEVSLQWRCPRAGTKSVGNTIRVTCAARMAAEPHRGSHYHLTVPKAAELAGQFKNPVKCMCDTCRAGKHI